jgi:hypothetical protein
MRVAVLYFWGIGVEKANTEPPKRNTAGNTKSIRVFFFAR